MLATTNASVTGLTITTMWGFSILPGPLNEQPAAALAGSERGTSLTRIIYERHALSMDGGSDWRLARADESCVLGGFGVWRQHKVLDASADRPRGRRTSRPVGEEVQIVGFIRSYGIVRASQPAQR